MYSDFSKQTPAMLYGQGDRLGYLSAILKELNHPDRTYNIIQIAGTNGKGSTANMVANLIASHDLKVGLFTSPHLYSERESIRINGEMIDKSFFDFRLAEVYSAAINLGMNPEKDLSQFELTFLIACQHFAYFACDWVVLECGLGGALDATNAISYNAYTLFTKIGLDHLNILGNNLAEIVETKSGIMQPHQTVVLAPNQQQETVEIIHAKAKALNSQLIYQPHPMVEEGEPGVFKLLEGSLAGQNLHLGLRGAFQAENLTTSLLFYFTWLKHEKYPLNLDTMNQALTSVHLPGRYEKVSEDPIVILDACHNMDAIEATIASLKHDFPNQHLTIICGFLKDKDVPHMVQALTHLSADFILTQPDFPGRTLPVKRLAKIFAKEGVQAPTFTDPKEALKFAQKQHSYPLIILGSFHLIKSLRKNDKKDIDR